MLRNDKRKVVFSSFIGEFKELYMIQSDNTLYINTEFKPDAETLNKPFVKTIKKSNKKAGGKNV